MLFPELRRFLRTHGQPASLAVLLLGLVACAGHVSIHELSDLKPDELMIVGKVELVPPLKDGEQIIGTISPSEDADQHNRVYFDTGPKWVAPEGPTSYRKDYAASMSASMDLMHRDPAVTWQFTGKFGEVFFAPMPPQDAYVLRSYFIQEQTSGSTGYMGIGATRGTYVFAYFPGGLHFTPKAGDRADYVGTIRIHRDKNNDVRSIEVVDEYAQAKKAFDERFKGNHLTLNKRLFTKVSGFKYRY